MRTIIGVAALVVVAGTLPAGAQSTLPAPGANRAPATFLLRGPNAAFALNVAYREIGRAEQAGATGRFADAARSHYRGALDRYGRNDGTGAAAEARLAIDLARAAADERPRSAMPGPKDVPAPPTLAPRPAGPLAQDGGPRPGGFPGGGFGPGGMGPGGMGREGFGMMMIRHRGFGSREFSATHLAEALKVETGAEARGLAQAAVDANAAAQRAALAGNVEEAGRSSRVARDLMAAVDDIVRLNHPPTAAPRMRRPLGDVGPPEPPLPPPGSG